VTTEPAEHQETEHEEQWEEVEVSALAVSLRAVPAWLASLLVHMVVLLVLAICTFANLNEKEEVFVSGSHVAPQEEVLEELTELEIESLQELEQTDEWSLFHEVVDPGAIAFGDLSAPAEVEAADGIGEIALSETTIDEIGALFGKEGDGMSDISDGLSAAASFFGAKASGRKFVFVVDNSNSMTKGRFETAMGELMRTVEVMSPKQQFYVIFFSDTAYRLFHPSPAPGLVPATDSNKDKLRSWLYSVEMCLKTKGEEAVAAALALNPDVIYILGDGAFTDKTAQKLTTPHNRNIPIHTVGMEVDPVGERQLRAIAQANAGTYRLVGASPGAKMTAMRNPIKRNRTRGTVWGIDLPLVGGKMGKGMKRKRR
jgi:hypothetical protein